MKKKTLSAKEYMATTLSWSQGSGPTAEEAKRYLEVYHHIRLRHCENVEEVVRGFKNGEEIGIDSFYVLLEFFSREDCAVARLLLENKCSLSFPRKDYNYDEDDEDYEDYEEVTERQQVQLIFDEFTESEIPTANSNEALKHWIKSYEALKHWIEGVKWLKSLFK